MADRAGEGRGRRGLYFAAAIALVATVAACELFTDFDRSKIPSDDDAAAPAIDASTSDAPNVTPIADAGAEADIDAAPTCPFPVDGAAPLWKPPQQLFGACTQAELSTLNDQLAAKTISWTNAYNSVSPSCRACAFSSLSDPTWQPLLWQPDMQSGQAIINPGACFAIAKGGSNACGAGIYWENACLTSACPDFCTDQNDCLTTAEMGACASASQAVNNGCGDNLNISSLNEACDNAGVGVDVVCGDTYFNPADYDGGPGCAISCSFEATYQSYCLSGDTSSHEAFCKQACSESLFLGLSYHDAGAPFTCSYASDSRHPSPRGSVGARLK